ncbi:cell division protein [Thioflavicoccus mobilis 8321]|uniref:Cell division protein FtsX n=1 Tax=Thioflavicoccus mobilis 8321 TaxID=765912 RepID=L0H210_9GAMM|nr:permease-like cell division protein FtsX [Thioflavicoccus mobilis]AGA92276.1 cell division protein [Thioflavicoccus mobilis 8321]
MTGRRRRTARFHELPKVWLRHQAQNALAALGRLLRTPLPTLMTVAMLGVAIALPGGLFVVTINIKALAVGWEQDAALSAFLKPAVTEADAERLAARLRERTDVAEVGIITRDEALVEFRAYSGLDDVLAGLPENPLPVVLAIASRPTASDAASLERLAAALEALPETDLVRHDADWVHRFQALVELAQRAVTILASVLGFALLLVVGNTIRLEIENRRDEIRIQELVGATNAFIRRPFVYAGIWYGLLGGLVACLLVVAGLLSIQAPVSRVAGLYQAEFPLIGLSLPVLGAMLGGGTLLGYLGSWLAVSWHLRAIKPE